MERRICIEGCCSMYRDKKNKQIISQCGNKPQKLYSGKHRLKCWGRTTCYCGHEMCPVVRGVK
jgi:hypothetical protein